MTARTLAGIAAQCEETPDKALRENEIWLAGQREALEATLNGASLESSLGVLVHTVTAALGQGVRAAFYLADADETAVHHIVGMPAEYAQTVDGFKIGPESLACGLATQTGLPVLTTDVTQEPLWAPWVWLAEKFDYRGCWSFPIHTTVGKFVGTLTLYWREPREATQHERELAGLVTQTAGLIISRHTDAEVRRRAEEALRKSEERFRALVTASSDVVYCMSADWSEMRHLVGREFIADTLEPSRSWLEKYIHPEDQPLVKETINRAIRTKSIFELEHRVLRVNGTLGWTFSRAVPILDDRGEIVEWFGAATDVTRRREAEEALKTSESRFRQLAEVGPQIVWLSGPRGELEFVNRRWVEFSGLDLEATRDPEQIVPRLHPEDKLLDHWQRSVETGTPFELEARLRGKNGEFRWFMMRSVPVRDDQSRIVRWFGTSTDIHESKLMQLELQRANQDLEQFAYSASHDLQEPIRTVNIFSQLLETRYAERLEGDALEYLKNVRSGALRMEALVRDLLAYSQAARHDSIAERSDAAESLRAATANLAVAMEECGATIQCGCELPCLPVHGMHLQLVFQNLIGNAIKYRKRDVAPVVHVSARRQNAHWLFTVTDNGIGIEPQYHERIFGLFKRLHTNDKYSGTGIGLAICQRIVERYHGRIWVASRPGEGSTFFFTLPA